MLWLWFVLATRSYPKLLSLSVISSKQVCNPYTAFYLFSRSQWVGDQSSSASQRPRLKGSTVSCCLPGCSDWKSQGSSSEVSTEKIFVTSMFPHLSSEGENEESLDALASVHTGGSVWRCWLNMQTSCALSTAKARCFLSSLKDPQSGSGSWAMDV